MHITRLLGFKLVVIILGVMVAVTLLYTAFMMQWHTTKFVDNTIRSAVSISDVVMRSLHYSMLKNHREDITQIIRTVGNEPGLEGIRVYNKSGTIMFSSDSTEVGKTARVDAPACIMCHNGTQRVTSPRPEDLTRVFVSPEGYRIAGTITPIRNDRSCSNGSCHVHPESQTILGVLDVMVELKDLDDSLTELRVTQIIGGLCIVLAATGISGVFIWLMVNIPVRRLLHGTEEIRRGNLAHRIPVRSKTELGMLAEAHNRMSDELQRAHTQLTDWTQTLEERVAEKTAELKRAQAHLISVEKMVSLGTLAATVAHELNNPLEGVLTYAKLLQRKLQKEQLPEPISEALRTTLATIVEETARCGNIVKNLLLFSRQQMGDFMETDVRLVIERSLRLVDHHLKMSEVTLQTALGEQPCMLICDPSQLEQAFLAMEINAVEAMPGGGTMRVRLEQNSASVKIIITDTGIGIQQEDLQHIFEPFFTTKHNGKGTGLGLAVVYGIVQRLSGSIDVESTPGAGTTFTVTIPRSAPTGIGVENMSEIQS